MDDATKAVLVVVSTFIGLMWIFAVFHCAMYVYAWAHDRWPHTSGGLGVQVLTALACTIVGLFWPVISIVYIVTDHFAEGRSCMGFVFRHPGQASTPRKDTRRRSKTSENSINSEQGRGRGQSRHVRDRGSDHPVGMGQEDIELGDLSGRRGRRGDNTITAAAATGQNQRNSPGRDDRNGFNRYGTGPSSPNLAIPTDAYGNVDYGAQNPFRDPLPPPLMPPPPRVLVQRPLSNVLEEDEEAIELQERLPRATSPAGKHLTRDA